MESVKVQTVQNHDFNWTPFLRQLFACSTTWAVYFSLGLSLGVTTVTVPQLRREANSTAAVDDDMVSWISSISGFVAVLWTLILILLAHYIGRMKTLLLIAVISLIGFVVLYVSKNATHVLISQALQGTSNASLSTVMLLVLTEYTSPNYRGIFLTIKSATVFWGIWVANAVGAFYDYRNIGLFGIICSIYIIISVFFLPESPYWLASMNKHDECAVSYRWLHGVDDQIEKEFGNLFTNDKTALSRKPKKSIPYYISAMARSMSKPEIYKPIMLCLLLTLMYDSFGKFVCTIYSIQIIKKMTNGESSAYVVMLIMDGFTVLGMYIGCGLSKVLRRRSLLLSTSIISIVLLYSMSLYLFLIKFAYILENTYITVLLLICYSLAVCCGPMILISSLIAEMIPVRSRFFALIFIAFPPVIVQGTIIKVAPYMFKACGFEGTFLFFAVLSSALTLLIYIYLPETKDKTLHEIENMFKKDKTDDKEILETLTKDES